MLYLKYRPQKIAELDNQTVRESLAKITKSPELPHAFLFAGPHGTGKTSAARIIAKIVNCETITQLSTAERRSPSFEPCNECSTCLAITAGSHLDILEIDAASNRGIDEIRDLREKIKLAPVSARKKVYIIDEAHMLTREAFNALLKTLEEPPSHVLLILATTEPHKLPLTIVSRCLRIDFPKGSLEDTFFSLKRVTLGEGLKISDEALYLIARDAGGHFRDAQKILEHLQLENGQKISLKEVKDHLKLSQGQVSEKFLLYLFEKNAQKALEFLDQYVSAGGDLKHLTTASLENLRKLALASIGTPIEVSPQFDGLKFEKNDLVHLMNLFDAAGRQLKTSLIPQLPLELVIIEWCEKEEETLAVKVDEVPSLTEKPALTLKGQSSGLSSTRTGRESPGLSLQTIQEKWSNVLATLKPKNHSVVAFLRAAKPSILKGRTLTLNVAYKFHKEQLESASARRLIEAAVQEVLHSPLKLKFKLQPQSEKPAQEEISGREIKDDIMAAAREIFGPELTVE